MTTSLDVKEFIAGFLAEAEELLSSSTTNLMAVDDAQRKGEPQPRAVRELFRSLHTLKGLAAMVGAEPIADIAHEMETLLRAGDRAGGRLPVDAVENLFQGLRAIEERVGQLSRGAPPSPAPRSLVDALASLRVDPTTNTARVALDLDPELLAKLTVGEHTQLAAGIAAGRRALRIEFVPSQQHAAQSLNITSVRERIGALGEIVKVLPRSMPATAGKPSSVAFVLIVLTDASSADLCVAAGATADQLVPITALAGAPAVDDPYTPEVTEVNDIDELLGPNKRNVVRVEVARLDDALDHLAALVVTRSRLERAAQDLARGTGSVRALLHIVTENGKQVRDLRASIMRARMVSVGELLDRAPLIVRGLSKSSGKQVRLTVDAGASELDKAVADRLFPAVVHLLRNAVDHAIEGPEERVRAGKPAEGRLHVMCRGRSDNQLELVIEDDGRGVDRTKVAARAHASIPTDDEDLLVLVTRPGLSTRDQVTQTSGRGMGMDIVRRLVVEELGGELRMHTEQGKGTRFVLVVPLSVTILNAFTFRSGGRTFVVPVSAVDDLTEVVPSCVHRPPGNGSSRARLLWHRSASIPLFRLSTLLKLDDQPLSSSGGAYGDLGGGTATSAKKAIIVRRNNDVFGFEVDRLIGQQEVVVRPLQDPLVKVPGVAGSTDLGDGHATLVLDLVALAQSAQTRNA